MIIRPVDYLTRLPEAASDQSVLRQKLHIKD